MNTPDIRKKIEDLTVSDFVNLIDSYEIAKEVIRERGEMVVTFVMYITDDGDPKVEYWYGYNMSHRPYPTIQWVYEEWRKWLEEEPDIDAQELADSIIEDIGYWLWYNNEIENLKKNTIEELEELEMV